MYLDQHTHKSAPVTARSDIKCITVTQVCKTLVPKVLTFGFCMFFIGHIDLSLVLILVLLYAAQPHTHSGYGTVYFYTSTKTSVFVDRPSDTSEHQ